LCPVAHIRRGVVGQELRLAVRPCAVGVKFLVLVFVHGSVQERLRESNASAGAESGAGFKFDGGSWRGLEGAHQEKLPARADVDNPAGI